MLSEPDRFSTAETLANEPPRRRFPRSLLLVAATAAVVVTSAGVAAAGVFTPTPSPSPTASDPTVSPSTAPSGKAPEEGRRWGHRMGFGGPAIRGEFVVPNGEGGYVTIATQFGDITAVDQDSVTVKSEDGHTRQYVINGDTRINRGPGSDALQTGQKVMIQAKVDGGTATAVAIRSPFGDRPADRQDWRGKGRWHHDHRPGQPPTSSPAPTPTATS